MSQRRKKPKPARPAKPRNPFAGRPRSGAGFHEEAKYGKKERRRGQEEIETGDEEPGAENSGDDPGVRDGGC